MQNTKYKMQNSQGKSLRLHILHCALCILHSSKWLPGVIGPVPQPIEMSSIKSPMLRQVNIGRDYSMAANVVQTTTREPCRWQLS